jgi:hypothetical protein
MESLEYRTYNIGLAREAFEPIYNLSSNNGGELLAKLDWVGDTKLFPFKLFGESKSPNWRQSYNSAKHTWSSSFEQANMDNVFNSLAGAFLLNAVHYPSIIFLENIECLDFVNKSATGLMEQKFPEHIVKELIIKAISSKKPISYDHTIETPLFLYVQGKIV